MSRTPSRSQKPPSSAVPGVLDTDLQVVLCGINPGRVSAAAAAFSKRTATASRSAPAAGPLYTNQRESEAFALPVNRASGW